MRTLRLSRLAYVVSCRADRAAVDGGIRAGLDAACARGARYLVVDVVAAPAIGNETLALLRETTGALRNAGGELWLVAHDPRLRRQLAADESARVLRLEPTLAGAVAALNERLPR